MTKQTAVEWLIEQIESKGDAWENASIESSNRYAQEWLAASGTPAQWAIFFGKDGPTAEYLVRLDDGHGRKAPRP